MRKDTFGRNALRIMAVLAVAIIAVGSYYAGICHAIRDSRVYYNRHGMIVMELDGEAYGHIAEGWVE